MDPYYGEIRLFAGTYAPVDWAFCNGQSLDSRMYPALFALIGNYYGGNGNPLFNVPNLMGMIPVGQGQGPGLTNYPWADTGGLKQYTVSTINMPSHTHPLMASSTVSNSTSPTNAVYGSFPSGRNPKLKYSKVPTPLQAMDAQALSVVGSLIPQPVSNMQPFLPLNFIICIQNGIWPPKP